jgi:F0F1-type ATP synthase assembly protein I
MQRSTGSYELVLSPAILALVGFLVDRWLGTTPLITVVAAVVGLAGAVIKIYYGYQTEMAEHDAGKPWSKHRG